MFNSWDGVDGCGWSLAPHTAGSGRTDNLATCECPAFRPSYWEPQVLGILDEGTYFMSLSPPSSTVETLSFKYQFRFIRQVQSHLYFLVSLMSPGSPWALPSEVHTETQPWHQQLALAEKQHLGSISVRDAWSITRLRATRLSISKSRF